MSELVWRHGPPGRSAGHALMLHGFGANETDLVFLAQEIDPGEMLTWHFPRAPVRLFGGAYAWFPTKPSELDRALSGDFFQELPTYRDPSLDEATTALATDTTNLGIARNLVFLGGFSQGSMMALRLGLSFGLAVSYLALFSTALVDREGLQNKLALISKNLPDPGPQVFISHGLSDPVLPYSRSLEVEQILRAGGLKVQFESFSGGHEIPGSTVDHLRQLMQIG